MDLSENTLKSVHHCWRRVARNVKQKTLAIESFYNYMSTKTKNLIYTNILILFQNIVSFGKKSLFHSINSLHISMHIFFIGYYVTNEIILGFL